MRLRNIFRRKKEEKINPPPHDMKPHFRIVDDPDPTQVVITEGQCMGFLKSGVQCSRVVNTVYCWQHNRS